jgi:hypothetical protein
MAVSATISLQSGNAAAANLNASASTWVDPGNAVVLALQNSNGVSQWTVTITSDYGPLNGWTYTSSSSFTASSFAAPVTPCKLLVTSEVTDGNNVTQTFNNVYSYPSRQAPERTIRCVQTANQNLSNVNALIALDGCTLIAGDRVLCVAQTTTALNGPYVMTAINVSAANAGTFVRPPDWSTGQLVPTPVTFDVCEGAKFANSNWRYLSNGTAGLVTVDSTNVTFYPKHYRGAITDAGANGVVSNLYLATGASVLATDAQTAAACKVGTINVGYGNGNVTFTCANANDNIQYMITNW